MSAGPTIHICVDRREGGSGVVEWVARPRCGSSGES